MTAHSDALYRAHLEAVVSDLRQALWDVYGILGFDQDGDPTPAAVNDIGDIVRNAAREFRQDYEDALDEIGDQS